MKTHEDTGVKVTADAQQVQLYMKNISINVHNKLVSCARHDGIYGDTNQQRGVNIVKLFIHRIYG